MRRSFPRSLLFLLPVLGAVVLACEVREAPQVDDQANRQRIDEGVISVEETAELHREDVEERIDDARQRSEASIGIISR